MSPSAFSPGELVGATSAAFFVEVALVVLVVLAGGGSPAPPPAPPAELAIAVRPVEDLPLLKKGGTKSDVKLPPMVRPPKRVKRQEKAEPAPTPKAKSSPPPKRKRPEKKRVEKKNEPPPEEDLSQRVDDMVRKMREQAAEAADPDAEGEGAAEGVDEGTETDPLKARAVSVYRVKLIQWFQRGFHPPATGAACAALRALKAHVIARIDDDRSVAGYDLVEGSGYGDFDQRVRARMDATVGQLVPPPPPKYPHLLTSTVKLTFSGKDVECN